MEYEYNDDDNDDDDGNDDDDDDDDDNTEYEYDDSLSSDTIVDIEPYKLPLPTLLPDIPVLWLMDPEPTADV